MNLTITQDNTITEDLGNAGAKIISKLYEIAIESGNTVELSGKLSSNAGYQALVEYLNSTYENLNIVCSNYYLLFKDSAVENVLKDSIGDGIGVTKAMLLTVTNSNNLGLRNNTDITSFEEGIYTKCANYLFLGCTNLKVLGWPVTATTAYEDNSFSNAVIEKVIFEDFYTTIYNFTYNRRNCCPSGSYDTPMNYYDADGNLIDDIYIEKDCMNWTFDWVNVKNLQVKDGVSFPRSDGFASRYVEYITIGECDINLYNNFSNSTSLKQVILPSTVSNISNGSFRNSARDFITVLKATIPPTVTSSFLLQYSKSIYVPDDVVDTYKSTSPWSDYESKILPISKWIDLRPDKYKHELTE